MAIRTTQKVVRFTSAFPLPGFDAPQPAGEYRVDHDEEPHRGGLPARLAARRQLHPPAGDRRAEVQTQQMVPIDPAFLDAALEQDQ